METSSEGRPLKLVAWSQLSSLQRSAARQLEVTDEQLDYAGPTADAVRLASSSNEENLVGLTFLADNGEVVGLVLLKRRTEAPAWAPRDAAVVSALRIDRGQQGRGLGTTAMKLLPSWVRANWAEVSSLMLSVDEPNTGAIATYLRAGWTDSGVRERGRVSWERRMTLSL